LDKNEIMILNVCKVVEIWLSSEVWYP